MIEKYFILAADADAKTVSRVKKQLSDSSQNPRDIKRELARAIVQLYHGEDSAKEAEQYFDRVIVNKDSTDDMDQVELLIDTQLIEVVTNEGLTTSKGEARRLIKQGAIRVNDDKITDESHILLKGKEVVIKVGKRRFIKIK